MNALSNTNLKIGIPKISRNFGQVLIQSIFTETHKSESQNLNQILDESGAFDLQDSRERTLALKHLQVLLSNPSVLAAGNFKERAWIKQLVHGYERILEIAPLSSKTDEILSDFKNVLVNFVSDEQLKSIDDAVLKQKTFQLSLGEDDLEFPISLGTGQDELVLVGKLGQGAYGAAFEAYSKGESFIGPLVVKIFLRNRQHNSFPSFQMEKKVLEKLKRLVHSDNDYWMLVYKKVEGDDLFSVFYQNPGKSDLYKDDYEKLSTDFYLKTGMIHGDIRPPNVIVEKNTGKLTLIDFGRTFVPELKSFPDLLRKDFEWAKNEFKYSILFTKMEKGYQNPTEEGSLDAIEEYLDYLLEYEDRENQVQSEVLRYYKLVNQLRKERNVTNERINHFNQYYAKYLKYT